MIPTPSSLSQPVSKSGPRPYRNVSEALLHNADLQTGAFILIHIVLGLVLFQYRSLSTVHTYAAIGLGAFWALTRPPVYAACMAAYVTGAEVVWRMTGASVFWEGGKYAVVLILGLSLLHHKHRRIPGAPLLYFALLLPSVLLTLEAADLSTARGEISFNLSGPLALFVSAWFFSTLKLNRAQLLRLLLMLMAPAVAGATYTMLGTLTTREIQWHNDSMFQTSGGFGPNQVSTIMGLGVICVWLLLLLGKSGLITRLLLMLVGVLLFIAGLLTFSRGGMAAAVVIVSFASLHAVRSGAQRWRLLLVLLLVVPVIVFAVLPALNDFTKGFLELRFTDTNLTNRDVILQEELQLFLENPIAGVGPGVGNFARGAAAHTELTRLLAEHGLLGATSLLLLVLMAVRRYFSADGAVLRGLRGSLVLWTLTVMTNAAMRLVAISFTFGLAFAQFDLDE